MSLMETFVNDMLDLTQMKNGVFSLANDVFDPYEVLEMVCAIFAPQTEAQGVELSFVTYDALRLPFEEGEPPLQDDKIARLPKMIGDKRRLQQILINLVKNAIKFTKKGEIQMKASYHNLEGIFVVHVADTGVGIAAKDIKKLFSRFGKLQQSASINSQGIGLGLTIVKQIVESADGQIDVTSEGLGKGSVFAFTMKMQKI